MYGYLPAVIQLYNYFLWKISSNSHVVNPRPLQLSLLLLNNTSNPILTSTRSHPFHFKARDWETIYSTKRRLNIDYWGSSKLEPVRTLPLWPPRTSTQFTLFSLSPIPKLLRAIPNSPPPRPSPQSYSRFWDARISSNLSTCSVHKQQQQRRNPGVKFDQPYKVHVPDVLPYTVHAQLLARFKVEVRYLVSILGYWLLCLLLVFV